MSEDSPKFLMRSFGRVKSRKIKPQQASLFDTLLPSIEANPARVATLLASGRPVWLEIGFGGGEHLAAQAANHPNVDIIGCEPFLNGVGSALRHIDDGHLGNVSILAEDARPLLDSLPDASLERIFILFADPWPKARHNKRRFIQPETVATFARVLKPGGSVRFATDWADYADWALQRFLANADFDWTAQSQADWNTPPADHVTTRYETKGLGDCRPVFFDFYRK
ncbi:tRNA (guanosine(46)-N7)-methyltransferase TrmB [Asticcacaulis sp. 201]|uniref:tRNA (guanosine(46)-N7)-methyltransferase TrmB n=1 Tax=Asticcacaulis sp. 201 TaxID=3028787 RepID=UPI002916EB8B|nr:tRNA (guanosine(46)-N7)-methyltransferase TrmB [Asticcacaulis sp. 201]MDV6331426.1 tRNA (guanosine(46)-N7)-methyltransferase TrmB [Asticcacaulis sp. 201]